MHTQQKTNNSIDPYLFYSLATQNLVRKPQFQEKEKTLSNSEKKFNRRSFYFKDEVEFSRAKF